MVKTNFKKYLVLGVIILFIGASIVPICNTYINAKLNYQIDQQDAKDNIYVATADFTSKNWTWLFYDDADFNNAYDPLESFTVEANSGENLNVIILQDTNYGPAKIWYINENHEHILLEDWGEVDMGDSQTLQNFLEYGKTNYPATRYMLAMYDHGYGWKGACVDNTNNLLTMNEMKQALTNTNGADILCFTAPCLMGALESVYELKDCVDVYVGSEEGSGYIHWLGTIAGISNILNNDPDLSYIEIGEQIIQSIANNTSLPDSVTMSAIMTDKIEELVSSFDTIAHDFINNFNEPFDNVWAAYSNAQSFGVEYCIDAYDFAKECLLLETNQTICQHLENFMNHMSEAVIEECHGNEHPDAYGLTIYFPDPFKYSFDSYYADPDFKLDFSQNTLWDEFLIECLYRIFYANQDTPVANGGIINSYTTTTDSDNVYEAIKETTSSGSPKTRYSFLEHKWRFEINGAFTSIEFYIEAYHTINSEGDNFVFAYSTNDIDYTNLLTVTKTNDDNTYQSVSLPETLSGTVYIQVKDGDRTKGNTFLDTVYIDHMYIKAIPEPADVTPPVISNVVSSEITYNSAMISWDTDEQSNSIVNYGTTIPPPSSKSDFSMVTYHSITLTGLTAGTTYYYEVQSTDKKDNVATDDNNGNYYTFTTENLPNNNMHVYNIDMWYEKTGKSYKIYTTVKIIDNNNNPVNGAAVYIEATLPDNNKVLYNGITGSDGTITFMYGSTKLTGIYTSTVTNVVKDGYTYNPNDNVETSEHLQVP
jgi:hypothetical protein